MEFTREAIRKMNIPALRLAVSSKGVKVPSNIRKADIVILAFKVFRCNMIARNYYRQNGSGTMTPRQNRRIVKAINRTRGAVKGDR